MDRGQDGVSGGRQDGARLDDTLLRAFPSLPQSCEGKEVSVMHPDEVWLFSALPSQPFVESAGGDQATVSPESVAEGRFFMGGFRTGVDEAVPDREDPSTRKG